MYITVILNLTYSAEYTYKVNDDLKNKEFIDLGIRVEVPFGKNKTLEAYVIKVFEEKPTVDWEIKDVIRVIDKEPVFNEELLSLAYWMEDMYFAPPGVNLSLMIPSGKREIESAQFFNPTSFSTIKTLTEEQQAALDILDKRDDGTFYLYGVTGSGKSEVFLRRAEEVIRKGRQVLYLVPEITLTEQLSTEVYTRFNGKVAIIHSALTPSEKLKAWREIMNGSIDLVIGARSSVFSPFKDLGLIILDEEHESSYKSSSSPRYLARQIAQVRAKTNNAQFIMGSATPSLEAWKLIREKKIKLIEMSTRIGEGAFPKIKIVNIRNEERNISKPLENEIKKTLKEGKQVILFLNRRGYSFSYYCKNCDTIIECPNCSVSLTYHKKEHKLVCHTCGHQESLNKKCPNCNSHDLEPRGFGTEKIEEEVKALFPEAKIRRLDTDSVKNKREKVSKILNDFKNGKIDILLGTQMIAKGLNFPSVALVGVLNADSSLSLPDFRASERTFQLLHQVSGRAGRYRPDGKVIIQTFSPLNPAIRYAKENNLKDFYEEELRERRSIEFPPFSRLIDLKLRSTNEEKVINAIEELEDTARKVAEENNFKSIIIFSSSPCVIEKKINNYRYHLLLKSKNIKELLKFVKILLNVYKVPSGIYMEIDVDPNSIL